MYSLTVCDIKDCIMCAKAWDDIRPLPLSHAWNKLIICADQETNSPRISKDSDDVGAMSSLIQMVM